MKRENQCGTKILDIFFMKGEEHAAGTLSLSHGREVGITCNLRGLA